MGLLVVALKLIHLGALWPGELFSYNGMVTGIFARQPGGTFCMLVTTIALMWLKQYNKPSIWEWFLAPLFTYGDFGDSFDY